MTGAVFLDRDGVINVNIPAGYVLSPAMLKILPGAADAIKRFNDAGIPVIVISNQQGVGKGLMTRDDLDAVDAAMRANILAESGAVIGRSYYCVHLKDDLCACRKPKGGQLLRAASDYGIDLTRSVFVGDSPTDLEAGRDAGVGHGAFVLSGAKRTYVPGQWPVAADSIHRDLASAAEWILANDITRKVTEIL